MANQKVNAVVIGSGAGGGVMAKQLAEGGLRVVLLERGRQYAAEHFSHDEQNCACDMGRPRAYGPVPPEWHPRTVRFTERETARTVYPGWHPEFASLTASVGGATIAYGGAAWRYMLQDFRMKTTYGSNHAAFAGSNAEDWPIDYWDLEPYYETAEYELGVAGLAGADPQAAPRRKPYPLPPLPINAQGEVIAAAGKRLGWTPFPPPFAIATQPYQGRAACVQCAWCLGFVCEVGAKSSTAVTVIPQALKTGHCELRTNAYVSRIITDERGRATGVWYFDYRDPKKPAVRQDCDLVVVAASAIETPRILLNSASRLFPKGLANRSDQAGRNAMTHIYAAAYGTFDREIPHEKGPGPSIAFNDWNHPKDGSIVGGGYMYNFYVTTPLYFVANRPPGAPSWGKAHKDFQRRNFNRWIHMDSCSQDLPYGRNRVDLDPTVQDAWGMPVARLTHTFSEADNRVADAVMDREEQLLKEAGAIQVWRYKNPPGGLSDHQNGTCRMGNDPKSSVVNSHCQAHDVDNLFIADTSVFVTCGGLNPSLTAQALSYRTADYILKNWKGAA